MHITDEAKVARLIAITKEVEELHELLKKLLKRIPSITHAEYTHGVSENGADFVLTKTEPGLGLTTYVGVIVKCGNIAKAELPAIGSQIEQCGMERCYQSGKKKIIIGEIWLLTNGMISPNAQEVLHHKYANHKILFINRDILIKLIDENFSTYWSDVDIQASDHFANILSAIAQAEKAASLLPDASDTFYIEQEVGPAAEPTYVKPGLQRKPPTKVNIYEEINEKQLLVIEGHAGCGKSKLLRQIAKNYCHASTYHVHHIVPFCFTFKELIVKYGGDISKLYQVAINQNPLLFTNDNNQVLILLDAADEAHTANPSLVAALQGIKLFAESNPKARFVVTTRPLGGDAEVKANMVGIRRLEILPLSTAKVVEFLRLMCKGLNLADRILEDLKQSRIFKDLPKSPIAAILLASLLKQQRSQELPSTLPDLYAKYFEVVLGRWEESKGLQTEKEYNVLDAVLMRISEYVMTNELTTLSIDEAKGFFKEYLSQRNYDIDPDTFFDKVCGRHQILALDITAGTFSFKHRTFAEFLYAKFLDKKPGPRLTDRVFDAYWLNTLYFYVGLKKDCPELINELINAKPQSQAQLLAKACNTANFLLAGYATPYGVIKDGVLNSALDMARLYLDVVRRGQPSIFSELPEIRFLWLLQFLFKRAYGYLFLKSALADAALELAVKEGNDEERAYALFFLNVTHLQVGGDQQFDFVLKSNIGGKLPLDIMLGMRHESEDIKRNALLKRMDQNYQRWLKGNKRLRNLIEDMYEKPVKNRQPMEAKATRKA